MKIERIEVLVTDLQSRIKRTLSSGSYDTGVEGTPLGKPVLVRIHAEGVVGNGQVRPISPGHFVPETTHSVVAAIRDVYAPLLIGRDVFDMDQFWHDFDQRLPGNSNARAALDFALHDAAGKSLGLPVHKLMGGCCQPEIPLEWSISLADDPAAMVDDAQQAIGEFGIRVLCLKAGGRGGWAQDVVNFETVRSAVGDDVVIGIDPNTGWTVSESIRALERLGDLDVGYLEQPTARNDLKGMALIRRSARGVPLMADESLFSVYDAMSLVESEAVDVLCVKLYKVGGLRAAKRVAAIAAAGNLQVNVGGLAVQSQLEAAAGAHFYASNPVTLTMPAAEFIFGLGVGGADPLVSSSRLAIADGHLTLPDEPGLGVTLDEGLVRERTLLAETIT